MSFGGGKSPRPKDPAPLPTPPTTADPQALAAANNARAMAGGLASTITNAGGAQGLTGAPNTGFKTLLGA